MHRCLTIVEIQRAIFCEVRNGPSGRAALARIARTCRIFQNVALDILWESLPSIRYLIQCLPSDLWKTSAVGFPHAKIRFQRAMSSTDWDIFLRFSSRIQHLSSLLSFVLDNDVVIALSRPPTRGPLVPNLKTLCWTELNPEYISLLQSLLTHSLVSLSLPSSVLRLPEMPMDLIGIRCPLLKYFSTHTFNGFAIPTNGQAAVILSETLTHLNSLEFFAFYALDEAMITSLSNIPTLVKLSGGLQNNLQLERLRSYPTPLKFRSLESLTLDLRDNELSTLASLLEVMQSSLQEVSFTSNVSPTPDALHRLFFALANACGSKLSHISLTIPRTTPRQWQDENEIFSPEDLLPAQDSDPQISLSTFQPLLELRNMKSFMLDVECNIYLDDAAIDALTAHWPNLTELSFNPSFGWGILSRVTHRGIIMLLTRCASLTKFALAMDFDEIDTPPSSYPLSRLGDAITSNCQHADFVTSSLIKYPASIAAFLSDVCPRVTEVTSYWDKRRPDSEWPMDYSEDHYKNSGKLKQVNELLPWFLVVRGQYTDMSG